MGEAAETAALLGIVESCGTSQFAVREVPLGGESPRTLQAAHQEPEQQRGLIEYRCAPELLLLGAVAGEAHTFGGLSRAHCAREEARGAHLDDEVGECAADDERHQYVSED